MLILGPVVVDGQPDVELLDQLVEQRQRIRSRAQTIVGTPRSRAYSNARRAEASSFFRLMLPQLNGVMPASRKLLATAFRSSVVLLRGRWKSFTDTYRSATRLIALIVTSSGSRRKL